jgi:thioredoxin reductase
MDLYDTLIGGGGPPAGLTAALHLASALIDQYLRKMDIGLE